jgi:hypothetical protein
MDSYWEGGSPGLKAAMTKGSLNPGQRRILEIIEELRFGRIEQLSIHDGEPCYARAPRIVQEIKLGSESGRQPEHSSTDLALKKEFHDLFNELGRLRDGIVDIEIRHSVPFRLVLERRYKEFVP